MDREFSEHSYNHGGLAKIYERVLSAGVVGLQLPRVPRPLPRMKLNPSMKIIDGFKFEDFELVDYGPHQAVKAPVAV